MALKLLFPFFSLKKFTKKLLLSAVSAPILQNRCCVIIVTIIRFTDVIIIIMTIILLPLMASFCSVLV